MAISTWFKGPLRPVVRLAAGLAEHAFTGAVIAGRLARPNVTEWSSTGRLRVLVVAPHPDDEIVGCAGTIMRHLSAGDETTVLYVTDGSRSRGLGLAADEMRIRRREEARAACRAIGVEQVRWLGLDESDWRTEELVSMVTGVLETSPPDIVYTPSRIDFHPDHLRVAHALALALDHVASRSLVMRAYQIQVPLTGVLVNLIADVSAHADGISDALRRYTTQQATIATTVRLRRYQSTYYRRGEVEVFWETPANDFVRLHLDPPSNWPTTSLRGMHPRPFTDPLAFWSGRSSRRACRDVSTGRVNPG